MKVAVQKVVYYTQVFYLDAALEYIRLASQHYELHVFIEITPEALTANIFNLEVDLSAYPTIINFSEVAQQWGINDLQPYFSNCKSVCFAVHSHKKSLSPHSFLRSLTISGAMARLKPDYIHFEDVSLRTIGLLPLITRRKKSVIMNVHDPKPHSGERNAKKEILKKIFFKLIESYVCFSEYSKSELATVLPAGKHIAAMKLLPYTYYRNYLNSAHQDNKKVTFVGRISKYKGIELFLEALPIVSKAFPHQQFCIAGRLMGDYTPPFDRFTSDKLELITGHLSNQQLVNVILSAKIIVCPYLDATQSGVIMTAYALGKPVIVTPVGGLPEYIIPGVTGSIAKQANAESLAETILSFLGEDSKQNSYEQYNKALGNFAAQNISVMKEIYS